MLLNTDNVCKLHFIIRALNLPPQFHLRNCFLEVLKLELKHFVSNYKEPATHMYVLCHCIHEHMMNYPNIVDYIWQQGKKNLIDASIGSVPIFGYSDFKAIYLNI